LVFFWISEGNEEGEQVGDLMIVNLNWTLNGRKGRSEEEERWEWERMRNGLGMD
jgi:hypothetical protein